MMEQNNFIKHTLITVEFGTEYLQVREPMGSQGKPYSKTLFDFVLIENNLGRFQYYFSPHRK